MTVAVRRLPDRIPRDPARTILRYFSPGSDARIAAVVGRVLDLDETEAAETLDRCIQTFAPRHNDLMGHFEDHFARGRVRIPTLGAISDVKKKLIGAYFTMEYAYASAALFNPSIVPALHQGPAGGDTRFIMSLRAVGEGHISSVVLRTGTIDAECNLTFDPVDERTSRLRAEENRGFEKPRFLRKLIEVSSYTDPIGRILDRLGNEFSETELLDAIESCRKDDDDQPGIATAAETLAWMADCNYRIQLPGPDELNDLVMLPASPNESKGIEDMRLVRFVDDDGSVTIYGTYTAYNGSRILPQLIEVREHTRQLEVLMLGGNCAQNKGMALFPRRIDGWYAMLGRLDGENLYYLTSDNVRFWNKATIIQVPRFPWQIMLIGNCGSPIETEEGWLVLTHGVGTMRRYCIGASLFDLEDPTKLIGQLSEPLLMPCPEDRGGYVPNVVYSCGGMVHRGRLILPYGISDVETGFAVIELDELLAALKA
ncbi:MAG: glycosidase [Planctomycetes bacterium]|nr:glycosidase [Planctomycetota bacterium]